MLCFGKFPVMKKFMDKRGGGVQDFPSKFCLSQSAQNSVWESFCAVFQNISGSENLWIRLWK